MRLALFILLIPVIVQAQNTSINAPGKPATVTINAPGKPASVRISAPSPVDWSPFNYAGSVNNVLQNLTASEENLYYYGWPTSYAVRDKRAFVARRGIEHGNDPSSDMIRFTTSDGGNTWQQDSIFSEPGYDIRNYAGGSTSNGTILIFYGRWAEGSVWTSMRVMRSTNGGANFTHSGDLEVYPGTMKAFSPHGRLVEFENGDLLQSFYTIDLSDVCYIYTLKSTDNGLTWGDPVLIHQGTALYEPSLVYLGDGKLIAGVRHDFGTTNKDLDIYNSSDYGITWDSIGKCVYTASAFDLPGVSPLLLKKSSDSATIISTGRGANNSFIEITLAFGSASSTSLRRVFYDGLPDISGNNIEFGYPCIMPFTDSDTAQMIAFYDASAEWVSGEAKTDMLVSPVFRKKVVVTTRTGGSFTSGNLVAPTNYIEDEFPAYNLPTNATSFHKIREDGSYSIRFEGTFTGTGTTRTINVNRYNNAGTFMETMEVVADPGNSFDFTTTGTMSASQAVGIQITHDASPLTVTIIRITITKL